MLSVCVAHNMSDLSRYPPGIGLALARHVLDNGHLLVATPRNPAKTLELFKEVEANGNGSRWLTLDVDDPEAAGRLVRRLEGEDGISINVLVNNAGFAILQTVEHVREAEVRAFVLRRAAFNAGCATGHATASIRSDRVHQYGLWAGGTAVYG